MKVGEYLAPATLIESYGPLMVAHSWYDEEIVPNPGPEAFMNDFDMEEYLWMDK